MANNPQSSAAQYRPMVPTQQGQQFASQQFQPVGQGQPLQYSQPMHSYPLRPNQHVHAQPPSQPVSMSYYQPRPVTSAPPHSQQPAPPYNNQMPGLVGAGMPYSSSYMYAPPSYVQPQNNVNPSSQFQPMSQEQIHAVPAAGQPWMSSSNHQVAAVVTPQQQSGVHPASTPFPDPAVNVPSLTQPSPSDWQEHMAADGRRYYFNKSTRQSSWEKPLELMTPLEMSWQVWRNFTTAL